MFDYERLKTQTAEPLIARFGKSATLRKPGTPTGPDYNPQPGAPTDYPVTLVQTSFKIKDIDGTLVQEGDKMLLVSTKNAPTPAMEDTIIVDGILYQVIGIDPLVPGSVVMQWKVHARK